jgi:hypothetical protein
VANAFSFQLRAGYRLNPMVTLQSGISLSRINETLQYHKSYTETEIIERQETGYILDPINGPTQITYTVSDTVSNSYEVKANGTNRYTFIDIPLLVNYSVYTSNKLTIGLSGGPVFNLAFLQEGRIIHANQREFIDLSSGDNPYRTTAGVNALFNVNAAYRLNRSFDLLFEPGFRMGIASLNREPINMTQRYQGVQLFSGLRYRF